jgi:hypothetical protein
MRHSKAMRSGRQDGLRPAALVTILIAVLAAAARGDVVHLKEGGALEGTVTEDGDAVVVELGAGTVRIPRELVASIESKPLPAKPAEPDGANPAPLAPKPAPAAPTPASPVSPYNEAAIRRFIGELAGNDTAKADDAKAKLETVPEPIRIARYVDALRNPDAGIRGTVIDALAALDATEAGRALAQHAAREPSRALRERTAKYLTVRPDPDNKLGAIVQSRLSSDDRTTRVRTAEVLGWMRHVASLPVLIRRYMIVWGQTNRGYCQFSNQLAYIMDYDMELGAGVAIPKPKVGVVQDGVVLDAKVLKIVEEGWWIERSAIHDALVRISGKDLGLRPEEWARWYAQGGPRKAGIGE